MEEIVGKKFECPSCGTIVNENDKDCPGCGAMFENGEGSNMGPDLELNQNQGSSESWSQFPPPPGDIQKPRDPISDLVEKIPPPPNLEEDMSSIPLTDEGHKPEKPPLSVSEFSGSVFNKEGQEDVQDKPQAPPQEKQQDMDQNPRQELTQDSSQDENKEQSKVLDQNEEQDIPQGYIQKEEQVTSQGLIIEEAQEESHVHEQEDEEVIPQDHLQEEEQDANLPVSLQGLQRYKDYGSSIEEELDYEKKIIGALKDYSENRKKRYTMGTLFLGLGVVLFVLLWLVVVYDVLVTESQQWFGVHIVLILVCAGFFFTFGLFMILTYPKSSLIEILAYISESKEKGRSTEN